VDRFEGRPGVDVLSGVHAGRSRVPMTGRDALRLKRTRDGRIGWRSPPLAAATNTSGNSERA
jgi:hypothetical protein